MFFSKTDLHKCVKEDEGRHLHRSWGLFVTLMCPCQHTKCADHAHLIGRGRGHDVLCQVIFGISDFRFFSKSHMFTLFIFIILYFLTSGSCVFYGGSITSQMITDHKG